MIYGSVCSGVEAATLAWAALGWRAAFFAEIEAFPRAVLRHHWPAVPLHGDFTTIQDGDYDRIDLLCGGTPCQSFSLAGKRAGLDDPRGHLTLEFFALARRLRPRWLVWENVPGVLSDDGGETFGTVLAAAAGHPAGTVFRPPEGGWRGHGVVEPAGPAHPDRPTWGFAWRVLDAQWFGVPQRRRRVVLVGYLGNWRPAAAVLFEPESLRGDPPPRREAGARAAALTANGIGVGGADDNQCRAGHVIAGTLAGGARAQGGYSTDDLPLTVGALTAACGPNGHGGSGLATDKGAEAGHIVPILESGKRTGASSTAAKAGDGIGRAGDPMFTLGADSRHAVAYAEAFGGNNYSGPIDVATAVQAHGGPHGRQDFESETFIAHALRGEGFDASEDGSRRGTPLVPVAFDTTQITSGVNRCNPQPGDPCHPLASSAHPPALVAPLAFSCKDHGADAGETAPTLRAMGHRGSHPNSGEQVAVAFHGSQDPDVSSDVTHPVGRNQGRETCALVGVGVRRLTPRECERLQGMPDDHTLIPTKAGKRLEADELAYLRSRSHEQLAALFGVDPATFTGCSDDELRRLAADGPRYKAIGNSWAVPKFRWLGQRIDFLDSVLRGETS